MSAPAHDPNLLEEYPEKIDAMDAGLLMPPPQGLGMGATMMPLTRRSQVVGKCFIRDAMPHFPTT